MLHNTDGTLTLTNGAFSGNSAGWGGGIGNFRGAMTVTNCTVSGNAAMFGSGIYNYQGTARLANTIVALNMGEGLEEVWGSFTELNALVGVDPEFVRPPHDGGDGWGDDPLTSAVDESLNDDCGDLRLTPMSSAVNAGDNSLLPADTVDLDDDGDTDETIPLDLGENHRIHGGTVDIGAYEGTFSAPVCDLVGSVIVLPNTAGVGADIEITWRVDNIGTGLAEGTWRDGVYLSADQVPDAHERLGWFDCPNPLAAGAWYEKTVQVSIPEDAIGQYWLLIAVDGGNDVAESDETNNTAVSAIPILVQGPDLEISSPVGPSEVGTGAALEIDWTVTNAGPVAALGGWQDRVYLSADEQLGADTVLGTFSRTEGLGAGEAYARSETLTVPDVEEGEYWIILHADHADDLAESEEADNVLVLGSMTIHRPNLEAAVSGLPAAVSPGEALQVDWTVTNSGSEAALGTWQDRLYGSDDGQVGDDLLLGSFTRVAELAPGEHYDRSDTITVPDVPAGSYWLIAKTDGDGDLPETDESDNTVVVGPIDVHWPNLVAGSPSAPAQAATGEEIAVSWEVENLGPGSAFGDWADALYLSTDDQAGGDTRLASFSRPAELGVGDHYEATGTVTVPDVAAGTYWLVFAADDEGARPETNEGDNAAVFGPIEIGSPDLVLTSVVPPVEGWSGRAVDVSWTVANNGPGGAFGSWSDRVYLSDDDVIGNADDVYLGSMARPVELAAGESYTRRGAFELPEGIGQPQPDFDNYRLIVVADGGGALYEQGSEANNAGISPDFAVYQTQHPDLQVTSAAVPATAVAGEEATFSWTVTNAGSGATNASAWIDKLYLSTDTELGGDTYIGQAQNPSYLAPGESYVQSLTATVPAALSGQYYLIVATDAANQQYENENEDNNVGISAATMQVDAPAVPGYLHVAEVTISPQPPSTIWTGQAITVTWTVENTGESNIAASSWRGGKWDDGLALSPVPTWDGSTGYWIGGHQGYHYGGLAVGESYTLQKTITLPQDVHGTWYVVAVPDTHHMAGGRAWPNNDIPRDQGFAEIAIALPPQPDLQVTSVSGPAAADSGDLVDVTWRVSNEGFGPTGTSSWTDSVYLSEDATPETSGSGADRRIASFDHAGVLAAVENYTRTESVRLPDDADGEYYLFVLTDVYDGVFEHADGYDAEANNFAVAPETIDVTAVPPPPAPDLLVSELTVPAGAASGMPITVEWTVTNDSDGGTRGRRWSDRVVLSADDSLATTGDNTRLGDWRHDGRLAADDSYTVAKSVTLPVGISGSYWLFVETDPSDVESEANEDNNAFSVSLDVALTPSPDLQVTNLEVPAPAWSGQPMTVNWTAANAGPGDTRTGETAWTDAIYLSEDDTLDTRSDRRLGVVQRNGGLAAGEDYSRSRAFTLPVGISGDYTLFVVTDANGEVYEHASEGNNTASFAVPISLTPPSDLQVADVNAPATAYAGQPVTIEWTTTNQGDGETAADFWRDAVYVSKDQYLDRDLDLYLGTVNRSGALAAGESYTASHTTTLPGSASGPYYAFVVTDSGEAVFEHTHEDNNVGFDPAATMVTLPAPADLVVASIGVPASGLAGQSPGTPITWTVTNEGDNPATGSWWDSVYLSADDAWDLSDALVARVQHTGDVAVGTSYTASTSARLPAAVPDDYHVLVRTDIRNQIRESDEENNRLASTDLVSMDMPVLAFDTPTAGTITNSQDVYYRVEADPGQDLLFTADFDQPAQAEFYVRYDEPPTRGQFDAVYDNLYDLQQRLTVSGAKAGSYYVLLHGRQGAGSGQTYEVLAEDLTFEVRDVTPFRGSNAGDVTVTLTGSRFTVDTEVSLIAADTSELVADHIWWKDANTLWATFDLAGLAPGDYDVHVENASSTDTAEDAFTVTTGPVGEFRVELIAPGTLRPGQGGTATITYNNAGQTDIPAPVIVFEAEGADLRLPSQGEFFGSTIQFLAVNDSGPAGVLQPGSTGRISIPFSPTVDDGSIDFALYMLSGSDEPLEWVALKDGMRPGTVSADAWDAVWANFTTGIGATLGDYQAALCDNATYLSRLGETVYDVGRLLAFEISQASGGLHFQSLASVLDASYPTPGLDLAFARVFAQPITDRFTLGPLGRGWSHNWQYTVETLTGGDVAIHGPGGSMRYFTGRGDGTFAPSPGDYAALTLEAGLYRLVEPHGTAYAFRADGRLDSLADTNGNRITCVYTGDRLTELVHSGGDALELAYDALGRLIEVADPAGCSTVYAYDASGEHLVSVTAPDGTTEYVYTPETAGSPAHALTEVAYPGGTHDFFAYDAQGRLVRTWRDGGAEEVAYAYDSAAGLYVTDAAGAATTALYTDSGQIAQVHDAIGRSVRFDYDDAYNLTDLHLPGGITYSYTYDAAGNLTRQTSPLGHDVRMKYGDLERLTHVADQKGNPTDYAYDARGNLTAITYADGTVERFTYDAAGNLVAWENRRGTSTPADPDDHVIGYTYNARGQLTRKDYADGTFCEYAYDDRGNMIRATDERGDTLMVYDGADRLTRITYPEGRWLEYAYDEGGRRTRMETFDGFVTNYEYDQAGRLWRLTDSAGDMIVTYTYDDAGRLLREDKGNGTYTTYAYDPAGQLTHLDNCAPDGTRNSYFYYTYDALGHRIEMETHYGTWTYAYDATGQLTHAVLASTDLEIPDQDLEYVYDPAGNRIRTIFNGETTEYATNEMNQYTSVGGAPYVYDADGNLVDVGAGETTYHFNDENRLTNVVTPEGTWAHQYNPLGNRTATVADGATTNYLIDPIGMGNVIAERTGDGGLLASYAHGLGLVARTDTPGNSSYYAFDAVGSAAEVCDETASRLNTYAFTPFGLYIQSSTAIPNTFEYLGRHGVVVEGSGLAYLRARYSNTALGRFLSEDPVKITRRLGEAYKYCRNNPCTFIDPNGRDPSVSIQSIARGGNVSPFGILLDAEQTFIFRRRFSNEWDVLMGVVPQVRMELGANEFRYVHVFTNTADNTMEVVVSQEPHYLYDSRTTSHYRLKVWGLLHGMEVDENALKNPEDVFPFWLSDEEWRAMLSAHRKARCSAQINRPMDPNDKVGPLSDGHENFVTAQISSPYTINFENLVTATAPAQLVTVTDQLDEDLDWRTLRLGEIAFGDELIVVPEGRSFYSTTVDLRPENDLLVRVDAALEPATGIVTWTLASIDPATGETPSDALAGFLPPEDGTGRGQGHLTYTIRPKADRPTGTVITNQATIVFDTEEPIDTNIVTNILDAGAPTSQVASLLPTADDKTFTVNWSGVDDEGGSGVACYDVYVSTDDGPYELWLSRIPDTSAVFVGDTGRHRYAFYTRARDRAGNVEDSPLGADAVTVAGPNLPPELHLPETAGLDEGETLRGAGAFEDADWGDAWSATVDYGDGTGEQPLILDGHAFDLSRAYADDGVYTVIVRVTDSEGESGEGTMVATVANVAPTIDSLTGDSEAQPGETCSFTAAASDPAGAADPLTYEWDFGDGTAPVSGVDLTDVGHNFENAGDYTVTLTVTDGDGGQDEGVWTVAVTEPTPPVVSGVAIDDGSGQRSMVRSLTVTFDQAVTLDADAITVIDESGTPVQIAVANPSSDQATYVVTFTDPSLTGESLADGHYRMTVAADKVHSLGGLTLTDDHVTDFFRLFGDVDGDRDVDRGDYIQIRQTNGRSDGQPGFNDAFDYDGNDLVDALDVGEVRNRLNTWLDEPDFSEDVPGLYDGDLDQDGDVDLDDLGLLAGRWGQAASRAQGDLDGDGYIDLDDLGILAGNYGEPAAGAGSGVGPEATPTTMTQPDGRQTAKATAALEQPGGQRLAASNTADGGERTAEAAVAPRIATASPAARDESDDLLLASAQLPVPQGDLPAAQLSTDAAGRTPGRRSAAICTGLNDGVPTVDVLLEMELDPLAVV